MKINLFVAYGNYVRYCKASGLVKGEWDSLKEFAKTFKENAANGHENCNYI